MDHVTDTAGNVKCDILRLEHLNTDAVKYSRIEEMPKSKKCYKHKRKLQRFIQPRYNTDNS